MLLQEGINVDACADFLPVSDRAGPGALVQRPVALIVSDKGGCVTSVDAL